MRIAPHGGPADQAIAAIEFGEAARCPAPAAKRSRQSCANRRRQYRRQPLSRRRGLDPEVDRGITHRGFDKPRCMSVISRCYGTIYNDFGDSLFRSSASVLTLIKIVFPSPLPRDYGHADYLSQIITIRWGSAKAVPATAVALMCGAARLSLRGYAIPAFLFAILLIVFLPAAAATISFRCIGFTVSRQL